MPSAFPRRVANENPFVIGDDEEEEIELQKPACVHGRDWKRAGEDALPVKRFDGFEVVKTVPRGFV